MEEKKKSYFISLAKRTVSDVSIPDTVEYEVITTPSQIVAFQSLLEENDSKDFIFAAKNIPFKPFAEGEVDEMRKESDDNLMEVYEFIYNFGTEETREKLKEVGYRK